MGICDMIRFTPITYRLHAIICFPWISFHCKFWYSILGSSWQSSPHLIGYFYQYFRKQEPQSQTRIGHKKVMTVVRLLYSCPKWPGVFLEVSQKTSFRQSATLLFLVLLPFGKSNRQKSLWLKISNPTNTHKWTGKVSERRKTFQLGGNTFRIHNCRFSPHSCLGFGPRDDFGKQ